MNLLRETMSFQEKARGKLIANWDKQEDLSGRWIIYLEFELLRCVYKEYGCSCKNA